MACFLLSCVIFCGSLLRTGKLPRVRRVCPGRTQPKKKKPKNLDDPPGENGVVVVTLTPGWSPRGYEKNVRALSRTLQTRALATLLHALAGGQEELKSPKQRKNKSLNPQQNPRPLSSGEKSRPPRQLLWQKKSGKSSLVQGEDDCAVRFTGAPGKKDRITVETMKHLLSSKGIFYRHNTVSQS